MRDNNDCFNIFWSSFLFILILIFYHYCYFTVFDYCYYHDLRFRTTLAKKKVRKSTEKDDDEDEDDEEDDDEDDENEDENENEKHSAVPSGRRGPSRGSKEIALNRISDQMTAPEDKLNKRLSKLNI